VKSERRNKINERAEWVSRASSIGWFDRLNCSAQKFRLLKSPVLAPIHDDGRNETVTWETEPGVPGVPGYVQPAPSPTLLLELERWSLMEQLSSCWLHLLAQGGTLRCTDTTSEVACCSSDQLDDALLFSDG